MKRSRTKIPQATGDDGQPPGILLPKPMAHQVPLLRDTHRHKTAICGRRWGKTGAGLPAVVNGHGDPDPNSKHHLKGALDGGNIWWVAPTFVITQKIERDLLHCFRTSGIEYKKSNRRIELENGGSITLKTAASPASLRGDGLDGIVYDEAAYGSESSWKEALRPALADRRGWSLFLTTPNGPNWVKDRFDRDPIDPDYKSWQCPSRQNPLLDAAEIESMRRDLGDRSFQQEGLALFVDTQGVEFSGYYFQSPKFWFDELPAERDVEFRAIGLDPSKGRSDKSDYSAIVMCTLNKEGHVFVDADIERRDVMTIAEATVNIAAHFRPHGLVVESNQFQELLLPLMKPLAEQRGVDYSRFFPIHNGSSKISRIRAFVTPYLCRGQLHFRRGSHGARLLVEQLKQFPTGRHDDGPDALEMALRLLAHMINGGGPLL